MIINKKVDLFSNDLFSNFDKMIDLYLLLTMTIPPSQFFVSIFPSKAQNLLNGNFK